MSSWLCACLGYNPADNLAVEDTTLADNCFLDMDTPVDMCPQNIRLDTDYPQKDN